MITKLDKIAFEYYQQYYKDLISDNLNKINTVEDLKKNKYYNDWYRDVKQVLRKKKLKNIL